MSDFDDESGSGNFLALFLIFITLCLHLATIYGGFKFIHWQLEESTAERPGSRLYSLISCWENDEEKESQSDQPKSLSHQEAAGVITLTLWLLIFGSVSHCWPWAVFPIVLGLAFFVLSKCYFKGGELNNQQRYISSLGYLTCCCAFATTAAYFLHLCHSRYAMNSYGGPQAGYVAFKVSMIGTLVTLVFGAATAIVYRFQQQRQKSDSTGTVASDGESSFKAMA